MMHYGTFVNVIWHVLLKKRLCDYHLFGSLLILTSTYWTLRLSIQYDTLAPERYIAINALPLLLVKSTSYKKDQSFIKGFINV